MNIVNPLPCRKSLLAASLAAFHLLAFLPSLDASPNQTVGKIEDLISTGSGTFLLTVVKGTEKTSVVVNESTLIRIGVQVESLEAGDTIWPVPGSTPLSKEDSPAPPESTENVARPGLPPEPPRPPLAVPPPPQPPKQPPQPPQTPQMPKPPEGTQPPQMPPMPGQQQAEAPAGEAPAPQNPAEEAGDEPAEQRTETEPVVEEPDPDSLSPEDDPLSPADAADSEEGSQTTDTGAHLQGTGASTVLKKTEVPEGILIEIETEAGKTEEQVYPLGAPILKRSDAGMLTQGLIAHIEFIEAGDSSLLAQSITAAPKTAIKASKGA